MSFLLAVFLGAVQGLTEFLPVSSSGHLVLLQKIFGIFEPPIFFDTMAHLGTLFAVLLFFRRELVREFRDVRVFGKIITGSLPVFLVGFLVYPFVKTIFGNLFLVGLGFLVTATLLFWSKKLPSGQTGLKELTNLQSLTVGFFQAIAILPGVSRSGATIVGGLSRKLSRESSFKFSFYLSIPAVIGANILQLKDFQSFKFLPQSFLGMVVAFVVGFLSLKLLQKVLLGKKLYYFSFYCFLIGVLTFVKILC